MVAEAAVVCCALASMPTVRFVSGVLPDLVLRR